MRIPPRPTPSPAAARLAAIGSATLGIVGLLLIVALRPTSIGRVDRWGHDILATKHSAWFDAGQIVSFLGSGAVMAIVATLIALYLWRRAGRGWLGLASLAAVGGASLAALIVKPLVARDRPPSEVLTGESGFGFPSGHCTSTAALVTTAVVLLCLGLGPPRLSIAARQAIVVALTMFALLVALARVVVGAHYATDTIAGLCFGIGITTLIFSFALYFEARALAYARRHSSRPSDRVGTL